MLINAIKLVLHASSVGKEDDMNLSQKPGKPLPEIPVLQICGLQ